MQNLNQIRARHVMELVSKWVSGKNGGEVVKKIPPRIMNNGLLAALAYSLDEKEGWGAIFDAIAKHLASPEIQVVDSSVKDTRTLLEYLVKKETSSAKLREATSETMAWLDFARRLIHKEDKESE